MKKPTFNPEWFTTDEQRELLSRFENIDFQHSNVVIMNEGSWADFFNEATSKLLGDTKKGYRKHLTQHEVGELLGFTWQAFRVHEETDMFHTKTIHKLMCLTNTTFTLMGVEPSAYALNDEGVAYSVGNQSNTLKGNITTESVQGTIKLKYTLSIDASLEVAKNLPKTQ